MTRVPPAGGSLGAEDRGGASFVSRAFAAHGEPRRARRAQRDEDFSAPRRAQRRTPVLRAPARDLLNSSERRAGGSPEVVKRDFVNSSPRQRAPGRVGGPESGNAWRAGRRALGSSPTKWAPSRDRDRRYARRALLLRHRFFLQHL